MKTKNMNFIIITFLAVFTACGDKNDHYDAAGTFEATEILVSSEATGKLLQFNITEGQKLTDGEFIGCVDTIQLYLKKKQLEASNKSVINRKSDIRKQIAAIREQIATQKREKKRFEALVKSNAATQKQVDDITSQLAVLEKELTAQISTLENSNASIHEESSAMDIQIAQMEDQLEKCRIMSPVNGTILTKYAEQGEFTSPGKPLFKMADLDLVYLRAYITSDQLSDIKLGQEVQLIADYGGDNTKAYTGTISWISGESEFTPKGIQTKDERANLVYAIKVAVKNDGFIKIGMYGQVKLK